MTRYIVTVALLIVFAALIAYVKLYEKGEVPEEGEEKPIPVLSIKKEQINKLEWRHLDKTVVCSRTEDGWRFVLDPLRAGHRQGWYEPGFDDTGWETIGIEQTWQEAGHEYIGVTWYRRAIEIPPVVEHLAVDLHFGAVDESAWVWLNGVYVGQHDIGPSGWDDPFRLDITEEIRWGTTNQITVRAMNTAFAGGIWQPVTISVLELAE